MRSEQLLTILRADLAANKGYPKSVVVLVLLRLAQYVRARPGPAARLGYLFVGGTYKLVAEWVLGVEIPARTSVGAGLRLRHGVGTVVNPHAVIGRDVMIRHGVTLGNRRTETDCPVLEDGVELGAGAAVIGDVRIGAGSRLGANVVVVEDVPAGSTVHAGATVIR